MSAVRTLGLRKRIAFSGILVLSMWIAAEALAYFGAWLVSGALFSWGAMQEERATLFRTLSAERAAEPQIHPYAGYVATPPSERGKDTAGRPRDFPVSPYGYLDDASPLHVRSPGKVIIGITGGSVACYFALYGADRLKAELTRVPRFAGKEILIVNLAIAGYKQPQQLMTLNYLLALGAEFDVIVNLDGFNEVALHESGNGRHGVFPAFPRDWSERVGAFGQRVGRARSKLETLRFRRIELARSYSHAPWRFSVLCNLLWKVSDLSRERAIYRVRMAYLHDAPTGASYTATGPPTAPPPTTTAELDQFLAAIWERSSFGMDAACRSRGIAYYHFLQPNQYVAGTKPMGEQERKTGYLEGIAYQAPVARGYPLLVQGGQRLRDRGVRFFDLTGIFADETGPIYIDTCCHVNSRGNALLATRIATAIAGPGGPEEATGLEGGQCGCDNPHECSSLRRSTLALRPEAGEQTGTGTSKTRSQPPFW